MLWWDWENPGKTHLNSWQPSQVLHQALPTYKSRIFQHQPAWLRITIRTVLPLVTNHKQIKIKRFQ
jgi:hypothetical protein